MTSRATRLRPSEVRRKRGVVLRRMTVYLTTPTHKRLALESVEQDRDMSAIVERVLARHFKRRPKGEAKP